MNQKAVARRARAEEDERLRTIRDETKPLHERVRAIALGMKAPEDGDLAYVLFLASGRLATLELTERRFKSLWAALREVALVARDDFPV